MPRFSLGLCCATEFAEHVEELARLVVALPSGRGSERRVVAYPGGYTRRWRVRARASRA